MIGKKSVALCTYNGEKYLHQQIESIFSQTLAVDEVIVTDDQSSDDTIKILKYFKDKYPSKFFFEVNSIKLGAKKNFEKAISKSSGDIIFLSDQDDIWFVNKVKEVIKSFIQYPNLEAIFTNGILIDENGNETNSTLFDSFHFDAQLQDSWQKGGVVLDMLAGINKITGATLAIKRELFIRSTPFDLPNDFWHDAWLGLNAAAFEKLHWINTPLIKYRIHPNQQVGLKSGNNNKLLRLNRRDYLSYILHEEQTKLNLIDKIVNLDSAIKKQVLSDIRIQYNQRKNYTKLLEFRLSLPNQLFKRMLLILKNWKSYNNKGKIEFISALKDLVKKL